MSAFRKYNSIENHYREKFLSEVRATAPDDELWCATEKIHGANLDVIVGNDGIQRASRNQLLADAEFNGSKRIVDTLADNFRKLRADLVVLSDQTVHVYGEIYGGVYPGAQPKQKGAKRVQMGVYYTPDNEFRAFDIFAGDKYVNYQQVVDVCADAGIPYCPVQYEGTLDELLRLDPVFPTTIPALHGLPSLPNNSAEGWVLKPLTARFLPTRERVAIKLKSPQFSEVAKKEAPAKKETAQLSGQVEFAQRCVTENRLDNVRSKMPEANMGALIREMDADVMEEVQREFKLTADECRQVSAAVRKNIVELIKRQK